MQKIWNLKAATPDLQLRLAKQLGISPICAQILIHRGLSTPEAARDFLNPSLKNLPNPFLLPDMSKAVARLMTALHRKEKIAVYGDYDVDGLCSTALLVHFFRALNVELLTYIPDRVEEGYGVHPKALEKLKERGAAVVVTVDCGTKSFEALAKARELGLEVIVTDHHHVDGPPPPGAAFVNPQAGGENGVGKELAGVGVVFFLLMALRQKMREEKFFDTEPNLKQHLDLVALATIGDLAPLTGINRTLVSFGLKELAATKKFGLSALKEISGFKKSEPLEPSDVGFRLAPRINAGGRISKASLGLDLLCCEDVERAGALAKILDQCNQDRQGLQEKNVREAMKMAPQDHLGIVVASKNWHPGIVGLIASKLTENFYRPAIALSLQGDAARGSARSIPGVSIIEILESLESLLDQFGGHTAAAGLTLKQTNLKEFESRFEAALRKKISPELLVPTLALDYELRLSEIESCLLEELARLQPFGIKNPEPVFFAKGLRFSNARLVGEKHLKLKVGDEQKQMEAIAFNLGDRHPLTANQGDVAFIPQWNIYQGIQTIQLKIKEIKAG